MRKAIVTLINEMILVLLKPRKYFKVIMLAAMSSFKRDDRLEKICNKLGQEIKKLGYKLEIDWNGQLDVIGSRAGVVPETRTVLIKPFLGAVNLAELMLALAHEIGHIKRGHVDLEKEKLDKLRKTYQGRNWARIIKYELEANLTALDVICELI